MGVGEDAKMRERLFPIINRLSEQLEDERVIQDLRHFVEYASSEDVFSFWEWLKREIK